MHLLLYVKSYQSDFSKKIILFNDLIKTIEIGHHTRLLSSSVPNSKTYSLISFILDVKNGIETLAKLSKADAREQADSFKIVTSAHRYLNSASILFLLQKLVAKSSPEEYAEAGIYSVTV